MSDNLLAMPQGAPQPATDDLQFKIDVVQIGKMHVVNLAVVDGKGLSLNICLMPQSMKQVAKALDIAADDAMTKIVL